MHPDRERWNRKYAAGIRHEVPNVHLIMYRDRLSRGRALDVAAGTGDNAALLALAGWEVVASDISDAAVAATVSRARELKARVRVVQAEATLLPFRAGTFDTVVCTYYHDPEVAKSLPRLLRPGGTIYYQGFTTAQLKHAPEFRREYCLEPGELRRLFGELTEVLCREEDDGHQAYGLYIGRR